MHGFSVYLGQPINQRYIDNLISLGYDTIFTSIQIPEEDETTKLIYLQQLLSHLQDCSITYIIDVQPTLLNQQLYDLLHQYQNSRFLIRIDTETSLTNVNEIIRHNFECCLNASTIDATLLVHLSNHVVNFKAISYCHNYYPRPDAGLSSQFVTAQNSLIKTFNPSAEIFGFIAGTEKRSPLHKGLPTIEKTRWTHPLCSAQNLIDTGIDGVIIGDTSLVNHHAERLIKLLHDRHFILSLAHIEPYSEDILFQSHTARPDNPESAIRSQEARLYKSQQIAPNNNLNRVFGDITLDNHLNGRYEGELQIIKEDLPKHPHVNCVARISAADHPLIPLIKPNDTFEFQKGVADNETFND